MSKHTAAHTPRRSALKSIPWLLACAFVHPPAMHAQPSNAFALTLPSVTLEAVKLEFASGGVSWDMVRRGGLSLAIQGRGEFTVTVTALAVDRGRVLRVWKSSARQQVSTGTVSLPGRDFVPDSRFLDGIPKVLGHVAGTVVSIADAQRAIDSGSLSALVDRTTASSASGVLLVAIPAGASGTSTTSGRFLRTETFAD